MHDHGASAGLPLGFALLRFLLLIAVTVAAGWALARPFTPASSGVLTRRVVTAVSALGGIVALLVADATWLPGPAAVAVIAGLVAPSLLRKPVPALARCAVAVASMSTAAVVVWFTGPPSAVSHVVLMTGFVGIAWAALCPPTVVVRVVGAGTGLALLASLAQVVLAGHLATPTPGEPLLTRVRVDQHPLDVLVVPHRPGWNLVHVPDEPVRIGNAQEALVAAEPRAGASGRWALVWLAEGRGTLWLECAGERATIPVDPGGDAWTGPDVRGAEGPEYAGAVLASVLAGRRTEQPWPALTDADAADLRELVASSSGPLALVTDSSARSAEAERVVRAEAERVGVEIDPSAPDRLVLGGHAADDERTRLAPWLRAPDLSSPEARRYQHVLSEAFRGEAPSAAGLTAWLSRR
ncbi:DUF6239 family natural product biosynthesis protein [Saccharothrix deserti]|uniref:DUF6239 family natural product biosynthesis protein n=1 Tax=Saccharothrix deserti TaxID=2593674 RepID=UPI00131D1EEE|nr:DUF6239 family natural product biosynthesis protein [Saccharothrix deserti]